MEMYISATIAMESFMALGNSFGVMELYMKDNLKMDLSTVKVNGQKSHKE